MKNSKYLEANIGARYWEDSRLNGKEDNKKEMPCIVGDYWRPIIELNTGQIINWELGMQANIHYKSADNNNFYLLDENKNRILSYENKYVIDCMCPKEEGYGDYVIMNIDVHGYIDNWKNIVDEVEWQ